MNACDYAHETKNQVRRLPTGEDSAVILCLHHFQLEMQWRRERNKTLEPSARFDIPKWTDLEIYPGE